MKQDELKRRMAVTAEVSNAIRRRADLSEDERRAKLKHYRMKLDWYREQLGLKDEWEQS